MSNGGRRLRELIKRQRYKVPEVADAIGVGESTIYTWKDTAPIDKIYAIAKFIGVPFMEVAECYNPDRNELIPDDRTGGENN
jgi:transcriptional regulator with XRE-family HTH domain